MICLYFGFIYSLRCPPLQPFRSLPPGAVGADVVSSSDARVSAITVSWTDHPSSKPMRVLTELLLLNEVSTEERSQRIVSAIDRASQHFPPDLPRVTDNASCFVQLREMSHTAPTDGKPILNRDCFTVSL